MPENRVEIEWAQAAADALRKIGNRALQRKIVDKVGDLRGVTQREQIGNPMRQSFFALLILTITLAGVARGEPDSKPDDSAKSPKETLKDEDAVARSGNVEQDLAFYRATNAQEKKLAQAIADADVALAKLQKVVEQKFGKELAVAVVHAAGAQDVSDIEAAKEKVDGDKAVIEWKRKDSQPLTMVKVEGKWKVSLSDLIQGMDAKEVNELIDAMRQLVTQIGFISARVEQGKYRSGEGVRDRVQEITDQLFSGNQKGGAAT